MSALVYRLTGALLCSLVAAGCGGDAGGQANSSASNSNASAPADARPPFELAQAPDDPCQWLSADKVQGILGSFSAPPVRVRPGQDPTPDAYGTGCLYTLAVQPQMGTGTVNPVLAVEASRLARNGRDWHTLLEFCGLVGCLLADEDGVYDPTS